MGRELNGVKGKWGGSRVRIRKKEGLKEKKEVGQKKRIEAAFN